MKIEVSTGEVVDKATILFIKLNKIKNKEKLKNIQNEYDQTRSCMSEAGITEKSVEFKKLLEVNQALWEIEDKIRIKEKQKAFDDEFIELARSVYINNDQRADIKKQINLKYNSKLIEEKEYVDYSS